MLDRGGKLVFLALISLTNSYGKACSSIPTLEPNVEFNRTWFVRMGDNVTINCTGGPGGSGKYKSYLKWELAKRTAFPGNVDKSPLEDRHRSNITCDVERLSITLFAKDNKGEYHCIRNDSHSTSETVVRIDMIEPSAPYIQINVSKPLKVVERTMVTLPCFATGSPKPTVKLWIDDGKKDLPCSKVTCHDLSCINFTCYWNVFVSGNTTYWCEAKNNYGVIRRNVSVEVLEKPSLVKDVVDIENNKFFCSAPLVHPLPTFRWKYHESFNCTIKEECDYQGKWLNATAPDFEDFSTIQNNLLRTSLVVHKRPIKAVLQCIASNEVGSVNRTITVSLQDLADETASNKMNEVVIIGIIVGVLLVLLIVVLMVIYVLKRHSNQYAKFMSPYSDYQLKSDVSLMEQGLHLPYDTSWEYPRDKLEFIKVLGSGAFGQVWLARAMHLSRHSKRDYENNITIKKYRKLSFYDYVKKTSKNNNKGSGIVYVAVKTLKDDATESEYKDLASEIKILIYIGKHCNIVNLLGACTRNGSLFSIMEYCPYGNLKSFLKSKRDCYLSQWCTTLHELSDSLTLGDLASIIYQIARGLEFLHSKELIHRDLAARNILLGEQYCVKISDFGLARDIALNENYVKTTSGLLPYKWMSPESMIDRVYNKKTDIWSFGIVLWEIFTLGGTPYPGIPAEHLYEYIQCGRRMEQPETCPEEFFYIMLNCWAEDPNQRKGCSLVMEDIDEILKTKVKDNPYLRVVNEEWGSQLTLARNESMSPVSPVTFKKKFSWVSVMEMMGNKKPRPVSRSEDHLLSSRLSSTNSDNEKNEV